MKRKLTAIFMAFCMTFSAVGIVYADDTSTETEETAEETSDETSEEETTEETAEETTTRTRTTEEVNETYDLTLSVGASKSLESYISSSALDASEFEWSTSNSSVATVSSSGKVSTKKSGTCTITAEGTSGNYEYNYTIYLTVGTSSSSSKSFTINVDDEKNLYSYVDEDYSASSYEWSSTSSKYVSVSSKGVITGNKAGSATVTAIYESGNTYLEYTFKITVDDDDDDDDEVAAKTSWDIYVGTGDDVDISAILEDDPDEYDWSVDDDDIAEIDEDDGIITGLEEGETDIEAEGDTDYTFTVYVGDDYSTDDLTISGAKTVSLEDYLDDDVDEYSFTSDRKAVATVTSSGKVTGVANGIATIICENDDDSIIQIFVTVKNISSSSSSDDDDDDDEVPAKTSWDIYVGTDDEVDISAILEDDPDEYDWTVDDDDIAEIDEDDGIITGLEEGETDIEAEGDTDYTFTVYVGDDYSTDDLTISGAKTVSLEDYLDDDVDEYSFTSDRKAVATVTSSGKVTGVANGIATIICENDDDSIIQIFVTVKNISSTTTTTETTTETTTATTTTVSTVSFDDISHRAWAIDAIKAMASKGYIVGVGDNKFSPDANCKRCDFTIVLVKILGISEEPNDEYDDISSRDYYYDYVMTALAYGIESGVEGNNFRPDDYITREEMMVMVYKGLTAVQGDTMNTDTSVLDKFTDADEIAEENKAAVAALVNSGAISGTSDTTLEASANITRAQMAVIMNIVDGLIN